MIKKVALMNEFSQADKNAVIYAAVKKKADQYGIRVYNTAMKSGADKPSINYMHLGIQAFVLLNAHAVDFVISGCGSGQGACMSLNLYPGVVCGYITDPSDAYLFTRINNGNATTLSFAKDYGWAAELKIEDICEKIFSAECGGGYPAKMKEIQNRNSSLFKDIKFRVAREPIEILKNLDTEMVETALSTEEFRKCFTEGCDNSPFSQYVRGFIENRPQ